MHDLSTSGAVRVQVCQHLVGLEVSGDTADLSKYGFVMQFSRRHEEPSKMTSVSLGYKTSKAALNMCQHSHLVPAACLADEMLLFFSKCLLSECVSVTRKVPVPCTPISACLTQCCACADGFNPNFFWTVSVEQPHDVLLLPVLVCTGALLNAVLH